LVPGFRVPGARAHARQIRPAAGPADAVARRALPLLAEDLLAGGHQLRGRHVAALERQLLGGFDSIWGIEFAYQL
jgi:hypothetical protein